ncbi:glycosyltransferase family 2 protein [Caulobacter sp. DWR1-3-2b1]|uniref:glycosyltransferase family 2 protein n=1 Tax=Caulobacter sp. DWR1-3-2b1 TaxID=2804670 RepID=UPI003CE79C3C
MNQKLVSVVIPTYNDSNYIRDTISSITEQTYKNIEIIFIDDCSSDDTVREIISSGDSRIVLIKNDNNSGPAVSRNKGVLAASGDYIAFCDSDDLWHPEKLEKQIYAMEKNDWIFTYTLFNIVDEFGSKYSSSGPLPQQTEYNKLLKHCFIRTSSVVYSVSEPTGKIYFPLLRKRQDFGFFLSLLRSIPRAHLVDEYLCDYRIRKNSVSSNKIKNIPYQWAVYRDAEGLSLLRSVALMAQWAFHALFVEGRRRRDKLVNLKESVS